jgi:hypothetical protein
VDGGRFHLLDLDLYAAGDAALDAGNCAAHMAEHALRTLGDAGALAALEDEIGERVAACAGGAARRRVAAYGLLSLARHVAISTRLAERRPCTPAIREAVDRRASAFPGA